MQQMPCRLSLCSVLVLCCTGSPAPPADPPADLGAGPAAPAVGYEIFVRSFADSNGDGEGDLPGILARLPLLRELGVSLLWLTPIHPSPSYHGYDVADYYAVHPDLGTMADLDRLIAEARRLKMGVLLDLVINHTSSRHPWFVAAQAGGPDAGRYIFRPDNPGWQALGRPLFKRLSDTAPYHLAIFSAGLPDLNYRDPRVLPAVQDIAAFWLARGIDGFRLDAARYLVEWPEPQTATSPPAWADTADTHRVWRALRERTGGALLLGEVWADLDTIARYYGSGDELSSCFNFPLAGGILDGVRRDTAQPIRDTLAHMARLQVPPRFLAPFLSNHDQRRVAAVLSGDGARLRLAAALYLAMPGTPFLYYGEEIGLAQANLPGDRAQRQMMPWAEVAAQQADPGSLWRHYQKLLSLRRSVPALSAEHLRVLRTSDDRLLALVRGEGPGALLAVYNLAGAAVAGATAALPADYPEGAQEELLGGGTPPAVTVRERHPLPPLPPHGAAWIRARR
jgi:glycosidase